MATIRHLRPALLALLVLPVVAYALRYVMLGEQAYVPALAASFHLRPNGIRWHALGGGVVLVIGLLQLLPTIRARAPRAHRVLGRVYVVGALVTGGAGLYLARWAAGGLVTRVGFAGLAVGVLVTTALAWRHAVRRELDAHRRWMLRSFALFFAAVTLRLELPLLIAAYGGDFLPAYRIVAWLSWVPNLAWAEWWVRRRGVRVRKARLQPA